MFAPVCVFMSRLFPFLRDATFQLSFRAAVVHRRRPPWPLYADTHTQRISISWASERARAHRTKIPNTRIYPTRRVVEKEARESRWRKVAESISWGRNWDNEAPGAHKSAIAHHWHLLWGCVSYAITHRGQRVAPRRTFHALKSLLYVYRRAQWMSGELNWNGILILRQPRQALIESIVEHREDLINGIFSAWPDCVISIRRVWFWRFQRALPICRFYNRKGGGINAIIGLFKTKTVYILKITGNLKTYKCLWI